MCQSKKLSSYVEREREKGVGVLLVLIATLFFSFFLSFIFLNSSLFD